MEKDLENIACDLVVIGSGMAGMAASLFAARRLIDTVQVGHIGEINFASGLLDVLGVHPVSTGSVLENPWEGIARLVEDEPRHPYARAGISHTRKALAAFTAFMEEAGYPYVGGLEGNLEAITPVGTTKPTYAVPHTMSNGVSALSDSRPCLIVDFMGLKGFSARQIASCLAGRWKKLRTVRLSFPGLSGELHTERLAHALETADIRQKLASQTKPHLKDAEAVGFPAVLGIHKTVQVLAELQEALSVPVFEIPTMLPAVTGLRLRETFERHLPAMGIRTFYQKSVLHAGRLPDGRWELDVGGDEAEIRVHSRAVILASGRFMGKGLHADRAGIRETIFNLPVSQPPNRAFWHHKDLLDRQGHPINRAGLDVDDRFRPLNGHEQPFSDNLFAAGSILAHQDWMRQKCGSGLAISTAYSAVEACKVFLG